MIATLLIAGVLAGAGPGSGRPGDDPKAFAVEKTNEQSGFMIRVTVDKPDRTYYEGEGMTVSIIPERDCYVYLLYYDAEGNIACLLPNEYQQQNFLKAKAEYQVPAPNDSFRFRARARSATSCSRWSPPSSRSTCSTASGSPPPAMRLP